MQIDIQTKGFGLVLHADGPAPVVATDAIQDLYLAVDRAAERARRISDRRTASGQFNLELGS